MAVDPLLISNLGAKQNKDLINSEAGYLVPVGGTPGSLAALGVVVPAVSHSIYFWKKSIMDHTDCRFLEESLHMDLKSNEFLATNIYTDMFGRA